jgi:nicotinate-nucleotide pyrophosphorylase (carboxylating)
VRSGGGTNHRLGLYDMVLVKDNHADAGGGVAEAARAVMRRNDRGIPVEVEVRDLDELEAVLGVSPDRILLDNMDPELLRRAVARTRAVKGRRPELEASGNVTLTTVRAVAETGVDFISVGALTHSAPSADVSMRIAGS